MSLRLLKRRFVGVGPEVLEGKRKPRWVSCRVKRTSQLRKVVGPRFKKDIHGRGLSKMLKTELVMRVTTQSGKGVLRGRGWVLKRMVGYVGEPGLFRILRN